MVKWAKDQVIAAGHQLVDMGLVARTWGNVSCRIDAHRFAITPSGIGYERLDQNNVVEVEIDSLEHRGEVAPSSEKGIHGAVYRLYPQVNFVIHTHQTGATVRSVAGFSTLAPTAAEEDQLGGPVGLAEYALPGTKKLRDNVEKELSKGRQAILMERHGALLIGDSLSTAFQRAVVLEQVCTRSLSVAPQTVFQPAIHSRRLGVGAEFEGKASAFVQLLHHAIYKHYRDFSYIVHYRSPAVDRVMGDTDTLPAIVDDFAQMVGSDMKVTSALTPDTVPEIVRRLRRRNAVGVPGVGALCCAGTLSDAVALTMLVEKNALAYVNGGAEGPPNELPLVDRTLMRLIYTLKYSKQK